MTIRRILPFAGLVLIALTATVVHADLIFFKDGYVIQGRTVREGEKVFEKNEVVWIPKGLYFVHDGARNIYFSPIQVQDTAKKEFRIEGEIYKLPSPGFTIEVQPIPPVAEILETTPWDDKWQRRITIRTVGEKGTPPVRITLTQQIFQLSTYYVGVNSKSLSKYAWPVVYMTQELGLAVVRKLLHARLKMEKNVKSEDVPVRRGRIVSFLIQAGWYEDAEQEMDELLKEFPEQKEKLTGDIDLLKRLKARKALDSVKRAVASGQHRAAMKQLPLVPEDDLEAKQVTEVRELKVQYDLATANLELARRLLAELPREIMNADLRKLFTDAGSTIARDLGYEEFLPPIRASDQSRIGRLETFLTIARQAEAQRKAGKKPDKAPENLLSLAVSGWLLGNGSAEDRIEVAQRLWNARQVALAYQKPAELSERSRILQEYERFGSSSGVPVEEMAQLIGSLPPPEPDEKLPTDTVETQVIGKRRGPVYLLRLPPEYRHGRPYGYPVLFVLHQGGEKAKAMLDRWSDYAAQHGYILVAPQWEQGLRTTYGYTDEEQATVLEVLRDLRRRFQVDSDRVFLFGCGEGGNMAYDVGLSHPDLFAGVMPMSARPMYFAGTYWTNAQYLPFYVVTGGNPGQAIREDTRDQFERWVPRGFPGLWVVYRGRGQEWLGGELPMMLDWMSRKTRANPVLEVGRNGGGLNTEFQTFRASDNRFYWLSTRSIRDRNLNDPPPNWNIRRGPATLQARIGEGNFLSIHAEGMNEVTAWFGRGSTIDFEKPVTVYIGLKKASVKVKPSLSILLEDLALRSDRQRPYWARLDFPL